MQVQWWQGSGYVYVCGTSTWRVEIDIKKILFGSFVCHIVFDLTGVVCEIFIRCDNLDWTQPFSKINSPDISIDNPSLPSLSNDL